MTASVTLSTPTRDSSPLGILIAFAGIYLIWGTTYLAIALAIQTVPPFISGATRFLAAAGLMYAWLRIRSAKPLVGVNIPLALFCGMLLSGVGNGFVIWAQQGIPSGIAALIVTAVPVVVLVIDWAFFSRRAPTKQALLGIAIAIAGVATIILHTRSLAGDAQPLHLVAMIAAVIGWSLGTLLQKRSASSDTVLSFTCVQMFGGGLLQLALTFIDGEWQAFDIREISIVSMLAIGYLIVFGSLIALNCYLWLLTRVPAQKVTTYALVNPVVALILGALVLDEKVTPLAATSAALVLLGVALVLFQGASVQAWWRQRSARTVSKANT
jgi:drug/metabolite transporter (DMT)-like permease